MTPIIEVNKETLKTLNPKVYTLRGDLEQKNYIHVPKLNLDISKQRFGFNKNWDEAHEVAKEQGGRMLTLPEFREFLIYTRDNDKELFNEITEVRSPWRVEWIDAYFEQRKDGLYMLTNNKANAEKINGGLMEDRTPGIDLTNWLNNSTKQGLPQKNIKKGNLWYFHPRDGRVAWFDADSDMAGLDCCRNPSGRYSSLGVRVAKQHE